MVGGGGVAFCLLFGVKSRQKKPPENNQANHTEGSTWNCIEIAARAEAMAAPNNSIFFIGMSASFRFLSINFTASLWITWS